MAIGTGIIKGSEIVVEVGGSLPYRLNSAAVRGLAGAASTGSFRLSALRGKSSVTVTIVGGFNSEPVGSRGQYRDRAVLNISVSPSATPSAYAWGVTDWGGGLMVSGANTSALTLTGPNYDPQQFNTMMSCAISCAVTINGTVYQTPERQFNYTFPGGA